MFASYETKLILLIKYLKIHSSGLDIFVNENKLYKAPKDYAGYLSPKQNELLFLALIWKGFLTATCNINVGPYSTLLQLRLWFFFFEIIRISS